LRIKINCFISILKKRFDIKITRSLKIAFYRVFAVLLIFLNNDNYTEIMRPK